ncbi:LysR family transcriptional regulator [Rhizobacter sp. Root1221]|uniref:LysR family transcriptional regulator n=1 Tax=Rhizobacter sp. Root1221 TaxID=1736433 RepID=UPI0006F70A3D|nr:LysR family transcriptional regulator [Rhizobacter sp. Root1221]KQV99636.1 LysR family transcriptional regulator [Rhizobacter sp. Root1221]
MQDRLDGVTVFVETVQAGGFARAAERLGLSRSAVAKAIARVEARLAVRLFHRTTRVQSLTDDGQLYYERCLRALEELRLAEASLESGRHEVSGRLRVSMPVLFGRLCVAPVLVKLAGAHPKLELDLLFSDRPVDVIGERIDLVVRNGAIGAAGEQLRARRLSSQRKVLCAAPAYLAQRGHPADIAALSEHDALLYRRADHVQPWLLPDDEGKLTEVTLSSRMRFDDLAVVADAAAAGMGLAWLPEWLVRDRLAAGQLLPLLDRHPPASVPCHALWPAAQHMHLRMRLAIDALVAELPDAVGD